MTADMQLIRSIILLSLLFLPANAGSADKGLAIKGVRFFTYSGFTRIVFELEAAAPYILSRTADGRGLIFTAYNSEFAVRSRLPLINDGVVSGIEQKNDSGRPVISISLGAAAGEVKDFVLRNPDRIVLDVTRGVQTLPSAVPGARQTVIVLDPGHGGPDAGVATAHGQEKTFTLELSLALRNILKRNDPAVSVILTRENDLPLGPDERTAFINANNAAAVISVHAAGGLETRVFILDPDEGQALIPPRVHSDFLGFDAESDHDQMLWGTQQAQHSDESGRLGRILIRALGGREGAEPEQAPIVFLKSIDSAAVMIEAGMALNRQRTAELLAQGIEQYVREKK